MHENKNTKGRAAAALALCFCVLALTSFFAVKSSLNKISNYGTTAEESAGTGQGTEAAIETPVVDSKGSSSGNTGNSSDSSGTTNQPKYIAPANGSILLKYSMDALVYSTTLDQYMTHPGIDITAELSSEVQAIADGTVSKVYSDDRYGTTVCIVHDDGIVSKYSNLADQGLAEAGDEVKQGQTIGCIGDTALFESLEETHLHFEMTKDGNCVDPGDFIESLSQK